MKKRWLSILLTAALLLTVAAAGSATAFAAGDIGSQISLISSQMSTLKQNDTAKNWYYAVTDLDHNGRLEFIAAAQHPADRSTNMKVWEVSEDGASLAPCRLDILEEETFPDILTDNVDTYHDGQANTWYYLLNDTLVLADNDVYTIKTSITLKDGALSYTPYSYEHTVMNGGVREVSHTDTNGMSISPEQYNAAAVNALAGKERGSISFEWLNAADADNITRLTDSFAVFDGSKAPTETLKIPRPAILDPNAAAAPQATPAQPVQPVQPVQPQPVQPQPVQPAQPTYLSITKNPTNESKKPGGTAQFVACANVFDSLTWTMVSPDGGEYSTASFAHMFADAPVSGESSTTLSVGNVAADMNGWGAYCTFYYKGQTARTSTAYIYVNGKNYETPDWNVTYGSMSGTAYRDSQSTLLVYLQNGTSVYLPSYSSGGYTCNISGEVGAAGGGASCMVYYRNSPTAENIYQLDVWGSSAVVVEPASGSTTTVVVPNNGYDYYDPQTGIGYHAIDDNYGYVDYYTEDGVYVTVDSEGNETYFGDDGSWISLHPDGSWSAYDYTTDSLDGGMIYG